MSNCKRPPHRVCCRAHFKRRARQRLRVVLNRTDVRAVERRIQTGRFRFVWRAGRRGRPDGR